jgi:hypothetical protein
MTARSDSRSRRRAKARTRRRLAAKREQSRRDQTGPPSLRDAIARLPRHLQDRPRLLHTHRFSTGVNHE